MNGRPEPLQEFLDAAYLAFSGADTDLAASSLLETSFDKLSVRGVPRDSSPGSLPVVEKYLDILTAPDQFFDPNLSRLAGAFLNLRPHLHWSKRGGDLSTASPNFEEGHGNTMLFGPGGLERRSDVWLGATLMAPNVRYPDHTHPPAEVYLVMNPGDLIHEGSPWLSPGVGGTFYNSPGIKHAMRSGDVPFFAFWLLLADIDQSG